MATIDIDGSFGEGGGQILRTSLSLAAICGTTLHMVNIRANREKPGLMRQHLACAKAVAEICGGELEGAELGSRELRFTPGRIKGGDYSFAIGSAGNTLLLAQAVLPVLLKADAESTVVLEGGTYTDKAPTYDFFKRAYLPCLRKMGLEIDATMEKIGFYPVGGGRVKMSVKPARAWRQLSLCERGDFQEARVTAIGSGLERSILTDELSIFQSGLGDMMEFTPEAREVDSCGAGNVLIAELVYGNITESFGVCGNYGVSRKSVARRTAGYARQYLKHGWVVGQFLMDQLMLPMALGAGGMFLTGEPTRHALTNAEVIRRFIGVEIKTNEMDNRIYEMEIGI